MVILNLNHDIAILWLGVDGLFDKKSRGAAVLDDDAHFYLLAAD